MSGITKESLEKGKYIKVSRNTFESLMRKVGTSRLYPEVLEQISWDMMFFDEDEIEEEDIYCQVYIGDIQQDTPLTFTGLHNLIIGNIRAPWINLENAEPFDEGGSTIIVGRVECDHFNNHWGKLTIIDGDLTVGKILVNAFEDAALFVTGQLKTEFYYGADIWANVGGTAEMTYGYGYCLQLTSGDAELESVRPKHSKEDSYRFLGLADEVNEMDVIGLIQEKYS